MAVNCVDGFNHGAIIAGRGQGRQRCLSVAYFEVANMKWRTSRHVYRALDFWTSIGHLAPLIKSDRDDSETCFCLDTSSCDMASTGNHL